MSGIGKFKQARARRDGCPAFLTISSGHRCRAYNLSAVAGLTLPAGNQSRHYYGKCFLASRKVRRDPPVCEYRHKYGSLEPPLDQGESGLWTF